MSRKVIVEYDRLFRGTNEAHQEAEASVFGEKSEKCFGCITATIEQCILLIQSLATKLHVKALFVSQQGILEKLLDLALQQGSGNSRVAIESVLCSIVVDEPQATKQVCDEITKRVLNAMQSTSSQEVLSRMVQNDIHLLMSMIAADDNCWEDKLRCVFKLLFSSIACGTCASMQTVTFPCLVILQEVMKPVYKEDKLTGQPQAQSEYQSSAEKRQLSLSAWLNNSIEDSFDKWSKLPIPGRGQWLEKTLFFPSSAQVRLYTGSLLRLFRSAPLSQRTTLLNLATSYFWRLSEHGEKAEEFFFFYEYFVSDETMKHYLSCHGFFPKMKTMISKEISRLTTLDDFQMSINISQGFVIRAYTDILLSLYRLETVRKRWVGELLETVFNGYIALKKLVINRTKLIDDAQSNFLMLLDYSTVMERRVPEFMRICVRSLKACSMNDIVSPVFIFERMCSVICPVCVRSLTLCFLNL
ncbi:unnamed protein product [Soboliphyme baturini]|uniref:Integrator complex subunit 7 n=1 Tax=Soboliphyme baturini TaxID=241478 RepID=A0A183J0X8_9BILA|nr:unnamed protein product [Soboliphyme baturini]